MLSEMPRQILDPSPQVREHPHARPLWRETHKSEVALECLVRIDKLEVVHRLREPVDLFGTDRQRHADITRGAAAAIRDDIGGHGRTKTAVLLVHVLNDALATVAARQVEVDVRPFAAFLGQETLEEQIHRNRIDRGDPQAVADRAIGRRPASLHEDVLLPRVIHDVPDNEEVPGELQLLDQVELAGNLDASLVVVRTIPFACADIGDLPQERDLGVAVRYRVLRKPVAEIRHRVFEALGQCLDARERLGAIGEEPRHGFRGLQIPFGVTREPTPRGIERGAMANACQYVEQRALGRLGEPYPVGRHHRHTKRPGERLQRHILRLVVSQQMTLQFDAHVAAPEEPDEAIQQSTDAVVLAVE